MWRASASGSRYHNLFFMLVRYPAGGADRRAARLGGANGVAILLPLTFTMSPTSAIIMLSCICWGALFGGAITSILFNIPGEPWSVATTFDGHPDGQGRPRRRGTDRGVHVLVRRRADRGHRDHVSGAAGGEILVAVRAARILRRAVAQLFTASSASAGAIPRRPSPR